MIKKYNQFVNERVNEEFESEEEFDTNQQEHELANRDLEDEFKDLESDVKEAPIEDLESEEMEEEMEEEGGDVYTNKLQEVADKLGSEVTNGKVEYNGQKIIFPSETEMFHVGNKKFKTADEVVSFIEGESNKLADKEFDEMDEDERYAMKVGESKSYKNTRKFK
jgi:L-lactate utilization protein LutC